MEFVIVDHPERRVVYVDDKRQGYNRRENGQYIIKRTSKGIHTFRLGGADDYKPKTRTVDVKDTTVVKPKRIMFTPKDDATG